MRDKRIGVVLPVINIVLLVFLLSQFPTTAQESVVPIIRARAIELIDENGKKRAQLNVENNGEIVFRLRDRNGTIRAKFGADEAGSGLIMMDDRTEASVQVRANKTGGTITLYNRDGQQSELK